MRIGLIEWLGWQYVALLPITRNYTTRALLGWRYRRFAVSWELTVYLLYLEWEHLHREA